MISKINKIHNLIKKSYPDAVSVNIFCDYDTGIKVEPQYRSDTEIAMKNLGGEWIDEIDKRSIGYSLNKKEEAKQC